MSAYETQDSSEHQTAQDKELVTLRAREAKAHNAVKALRHAAMDIYATGPESKEFADAIRAVNAERAEAITAGMLANLLEQDTTGRLFDDARALAVRLAAAPDDFYESIKGTPHLIEALGKAVRAVDRVDPAPQAKPGKYGGPRTFEPTRREIAKGMTATTALWAGGTMLGRRAIGSKDPAGDALLGGLGGVAYDEVTKPIKKKLLTIALNEQEFRDIQSLIADRLLYPDGVDAPEVVSADPRVRMRQLVDQYIETRLEIDPLLTRLGNRKLNERWAGFDDRMKQAMALTEQGFDARNLFSMTIRYLQFFRDEWNDHLNASREIGADGSVLHTDSKMEHAQMQLEQLEATISRASGVSRSVPRGMEALGRQG